MSENKEKIALVKDDPWLEPYEADIEQRVKRCMDTIDEIANQHGSLIEFARAYQYLGINWDEEKQGWYYREWAPAAHALFFIGDFNNWDRASHAMTRLDNGVWEIFLPASDYAESFRHEGLVKVHVVGDNGSMDRIPAFIHRAVQDPHTHDFSGQHWQPSEPFVWTDEKFDLSAIDAPLIYECHVGLATERQDVGTYNEFRENVLPRIKDLGYNAIQMMAIQEHPYYGSFGYHVSNFFAPSSRFGTPEELKALINEAHRMGIAVIMDVVHSHAVKNMAEGLNQFDGSDEQYFHSGGRGYHEGWDSKLFNYGKREVQQFLLSNLAWWLEEFHFDGFRFDGVTSMLYFHHGNISFDHYDRYFKDGVEWDAITYLQMANELIHRIKPPAISIAEDMSGMPGACRKVQEGGLGFDYRLAMGIPDYWIKLLKHSNDEDWNLQELWHTLTNRRWKEKTVAYAESHDQALVGDKTIAFWLMDKEMYWHMAINDENLIIDRGIALHKMIRLVTIALGGEAYLNFIGNEFGHPEWVDFPRAGNDWSYQYARRQWSLVDNPDLKYQFLNNFDRAMIHLIKVERVLDALPARRLHVDDSNQVLIFERNNLIFAFNFHPDRSIPDYKFHLPEGGSYKLILNSDDLEFGGFSRVDDSIRYHALQPKSVENWPEMSIYLPNRTALVFKRS